MSIITEERVIRETTFPIAEMFVSPQGEGQYTGTSMAFIRFAGCNVGKPFSKEERGSLFYPDLKIYQEKCQAWDGSYFACDTNYRMTHKITLDALLTHGNVERALRVCLTGGEPLMHDIYPLVQGLFHEGKKVHIETSGTKSFRDLKEVAELSDSFLWVCVSPKYGFMEESIALADEIKVLVNSQFNYEEFEENFGEYLDKVWIQPINHENSIDIIHAGKCLEIQNKYPMVRISCQLHKVLQCR